MHQILFLQSVCRLLWLFPSPASRPEPRGEQAQRLKGLQPDLIRWRGDVTLECLKSLQWRPTGPDYKCINAEMASFVGSEQTCPCPPACEERTYVATTSSANWVAMHFKVGLDLLLYPTIIFFLRRQLPHFTMLMRTTLSMICWKSMCSSTVY